MKNRYFAFFAPSSQPYYFAIRAHEKEEVQLLINACSNYTSKLREKEIWYIGELTQFEIENFLHLYEIIDWVKKERSESDEKV